MSVETPKDQSDAASSTSNIRWWLLGFAFLLLLFLLGLWQAKDKPLEKTLEEKRSKMVAVGDLGGVPVAIPSYFTGTILSYDDDPSFWGDEFHTRPKQSQRTELSKIAGFRFDVRYPDMAGKSTIFLDAEHARAQASGKVTGWISVTVESGAHSYYGERRYRIAKSWSGSYSHDSKSYTRMPDETIDGTVMEVYMVLGNDPKTGLPYRDDEDDVFIVRDKNTRKITDYFECSARDYVPRPPCSHDFNLSPKMDARVSISYPRQMLPKWKDIQAKVKKLIYSFEITHKPKK